MMTKERRAELESLADKDPHMCLLRELLNEIAELEARTVVVPDLEDGDDVWQDAAFKGVNYSAGLRDGYNLAKSRARAIPADRVLGDGMVQVRLEWLRDALALLMDFDNAPAPVSTSQRLYALLSAPEALAPNNRANQGSANGN